MKVKDGIYVLKKSIFQTIKFNFLFHNDHFQSDETFFSLKEEILQM